MLARGLLMMLAATAGGLRRAGPNDCRLQWVRVGVIVTGLVMSALFFSRL
jgi:hypothetical protein